MDAIQVRENIGESSNLFQRSITDTSRLIGLTVTSVSQFLHPLPTLTKLYEVGPLKYNFKLVNACTILE